MPIKYHDDFMEDVRVMIKNITDCKRKGDKVGAARESLKLANAKVAYYEQFLGIDAPHSNYAKAYQEDYENALQRRADVRDEAAEYGIYED